MRSAGAVRVMTVTGAELASVIALIGPDPDAERRYREVLVREAVLAEREQAWSQGYAEGYTQAEADMAAAWRAAAEPIAHPERSAPRRLRAAIAGERRDQAQHEAAFVARAYATDRRDRTDVQQAAVFCYPPPQRKAGTA